MNNGSIVNPVISRLPDGFELIDVESMEFVSANEEVFDLSIEEDETYTANGFMVHNSIHPWCQCQLHPVIDGFGFVKKRVAAKRFTARGKEYKLGQIIEDDEYSRLSSTQKEKTRADAILTYVGEDAKPSVSKSIESLVRSENENCNCEY